MFEAICNGVAFVGTIGAEELIFHTVRAVTPSYISVPMKMLYRVGGLAIASCVGTQLTKAMKKAGEGLLEKQEKAIGLEIIGTIE